MERPPHEIDPVVEFYKKDIDRTLIRQNLKRSVEERFLNATEMTRLADELRRAGKELRRRQARGE